MNEPFPLFPHHALITGGSRGIGAAAVLAFARAGYDVAFTWHSHPDAAGAVLQQARALAPDRQFLALQADAADPAAARRAAAEAEQAFGRLEVLVCNAGIAQQKLFTDLTDEDWRRMFAVNVDGMFYTIRAALPHFIHCKAGKILTLSSMWGQVGGSCEVAYSAAKAAVTGIRYVEEHGSGDVKSLQQLHSEIKEIP